MTCASPLLPPDVTLNRPIAGTTSPVGPKAALPAPAGNTIAGGTGAGPGACGMPAPSYAVDVLVSRLATSAACVGGSAMPHGSPKFASTARALVPVMLAVSAVVENPFGVTVSVVVALPS